MIRVFGLHKTYRDSERSQEVLRDASFEVAAGEFVAIRGRSGSGKTTLINVIGGLDREYEGRVEVDGLALDSLAEAELAHYRRRKIGFVFQSFHLLNHLTLLDNVTLAAAFEETRAARDPAEVRTRAMELLELVDLQERADDLPTTLSGGQKQRVAIARALFNAPPIVVCDEPTGNLDARTAESILDVFGNLNERLGTTLLIVTHDAHVSARAGREVTVLNGQVHDGHVHDGHVHATPQAATEASPP